MTSLTAAKSKYLDGDYAGALSLNERAADEGMALGLRFAGVCLFRLQRYPESEQRLREALEALPEACHPYVLNHLGATLRAMGRFDEAEATFLRGLELAGGDPSARGRLFGNLGALYDQLERRDRAIDCYARFEELMRVSGEEAKLANAVGLVARQLARSGELALAEERGEEELEIARRLGLRSIEVSALVHLADVASKRGELDAARARYREARDAAVKFGQRARCFSACWRWGRFETENDHLAEALRLFEEAERYLGADEPESLARLSEGRAQWASKAQLHGEALWHLERAITVRTRVLDAQPELTEAKKAKLDDLKKRLAAEALRVTRSPEEIASLDDLLPGWEDLAEGEAHWAWMKRAREQAAKVWRLRLATAWEALDADSQADLVRVSLAYGGGGDHGVVAALLVRMMERLLRILYGLRSDVSSGKVWERGERSHPGLKATLKRLLVVDGTRFDLLDLRHAFAHGRPYDATRLQVDAALRFLCFDPASPLLGSTSAGSSR